MGPAHLLATLVKAHLWACLLKHTKSTLWFNEKLSMHGKVWLHLMRRSDAKLPKSVYHSLGSDLGCVCFGWKSFSEMLFRKCGCLVGPENRIFRKLISVDQKRKKGFDYGNEFPFLFSLRMNSRERERERERERKRERERETHALVRTVHTHWAPGRAVRKHQCRRSRSRAVDRDPRSRSRAVHCDLSFAPIAIDVVLREIAIDASRDRAVDRNLAFAPIAIGAVLRDIASDTSWDRAVDRDLAKRRGASNPVEHRASIWVLSVFFWVCLFLLFQTPKNIFRKFFWNATKHMKTFSFPENSISGRWNIFRKCFYTNQTQPYCHISSLLCVYFTSTSYMGLRVHGALHDTII